MKITVGNNEYEVEKVVFLGKDEFYIYAKEDTLERMENTLHSSLSISDSCPGNWRGMVMRQSNRINLILEKIDPEYLIIN